MNKRSNCNTGKSNKPNGKTRVRKNFNKRSDLNSEVRIPENMQKGFNDPMWYAKNEQMLRDAASYSYNSPIGTDLPFQFDLTIKHDLKTTAVPSLMSVQFIMGPGVSEDAASPVNLAAQNIYSYVRYHNSGSKNYDSPDLMMYLLAMDSLYAAWNWLKRIYGYCFVYSQYNTTMPECFAAADHIDLADFRANLANFREYLNLTAAQISSFCVPAVMPLFTRHSWMCSNIYKDSNTNKAQMYMFVPRLFYKFSETGSTYGTSLIPVDIPGFKAGGTHLATLSEVQTWFSDLINAVSYSEDFGIMSGDILKAYGQEKLFKLSPVMDDYSVIPVYNEEVLTQIHNATVLVGYKADTMHVVQDPTNGWVKWTPMFNAGGAMSFKNNVLVNMPWDDVTPANTMVATRLTATFKKTDDQGTFAIGAMGSEFISGLRLIRFYQGGLHVSANFGQYFSLHAGSTDDDIFRLMDTVTQISQFDWHPMIDLFSGKDSSLTFAGHLGDINNYTTMTTLDLQRIHRTAVLSEYNVPQLGSF